MLLSNSYDWTFNISNPNGRACFGVMMLCFFPILGENTKPDPILHDIHQTILTQEKRYRLDVLAFKDDKKTIFSLITSIKRLTAK